MKLVRAQAMNIPEPAVRSAERRRDIYPSLPSSRHLAHGAAHHASPAATRQESPAGQANTQATPAAAPPAMAQAQPFAEAPHPLASTARMVATHPELRQAIREELRALRAQRPAPVRERVQERMPEQVQDRVDERRETFDAVDDRSFFADPWADEFGEDAAQASAPSVAQPVAQPPVQPLVQPLTQTAIVVSDGYGPLAQMSRHLRIQAAEGYRAGVIRLKNGMYLVAEIQQAALEPEFGIIEVLAPLAINAAAKALEDPDTQKAIVHGASQGMHAVGHGVSQLVHHRHPQRGQGHPGPGRRPPARPMVARQPAPMVSPMMAPAYGPWHPGYFQPQQQAYPGGYPGGPVAALPPASRHPQLPAASEANTQMALRQEALPWADEDDFAGLAGCMTPEYGW